MEKIAMVLSIVVPLWAIAKSISRYTQRIEVKFNSLELTTKELVDNEAELKKEVHDLRNYILELMTTCR